MGTEKGGDVEKDGGEYLHDVSRAMMALRLEAPAEVVDDVEAKVYAAIEYHRGRIRAALQDVQTGDEERIALSRNGLWLKDDGDFHKLSDEWRVGTFRLSAPVQTGDEDEGPTMEGALGPGGARALRDAGAQMRRLANPWEESACDLLHRLLQWDHLDTAGDGSYWRNEIARVLVQGGRE